MKRRERGTDRCFASARSVSVMHPAEFDVVQCLALLSEEVLTATCVAIAPRCCRADWGPRCSVGIKIATFS